MIFLALCTPSVPQGVCGTSSLTDIPDLGTTLQVQRDSHLMVGEVTKIEPESMYGGPVVYVSVPEPPEVDTETLRREVFHRRLEEGVHFAESLHDI